MKIKYSIWVEKEDNSACLIEERKASSYAQNHVKQFEFEAESWEEAKEVYFRFLDGLQTAHE